MTDDVWRSIDSPAEAELAMTVSTYGTVDRLVVAIPSLRPTVAALMPAYADPGVVGWYEGYGRWLQAAQAEQRDPPERMAEFPEIDAALHVLSQVAPRALAMRRLLGIALLSRTWHLASPSGEPVADIAVGTGQMVGALIPIVQQAQPAASAAEVEAGAETLLGDYLANADQYPDLASWPTMVTDALDEHLIPTGVAKQVLPSCQWSVVPRTEEGGIAVTFETRQRVQVAMSDVDAILDPFQWTSDLPPWCSMDSTTGQTAFTGSDTFKEVVALECPLGMGKITTVLDFKSHAFPDNPGSVLTYRLNPNSATTGGDGLVTIDEGSLYIRQLATGPSESLEIVTTKRIQLKPLVDEDVFSAAMMAEAVCQLGWAALAEHFINQVALVKPDSLQIVTGAPGTGGAGVGTAESAAAGDDTGVLLADVLDDLGSVCQSSLKECRAGIASSYDRIVAGEYGLGPYLADVAKLVDHWVRHTKSVFEVANNAMSGKANRGSGQ